MKHTKLFEEFYFNEAFLAKKFDKPTAPKEPFKRDLTDEEIDFLRRKFNSFSWSNVDALGRIILGGGMSDVGMYYITEKDLSKFIKEELKESKSWEDVEIDDVVTVNNKKGKIVALLGKENEDDESEEKWFEVNFDDDTSDHYPISKINFE